MSETQNNNKKKLTDEEILEEIKRLSREAHSSSNPQLNLLDSLDIEDREFDDNFNGSILSETANPDESHRLYYTMRAVMIKNLPRGKKNLKLRRLIYDQKSLFLNRGKEKDESGIRGSDERMAYIDNFLRIAFDTTINWVREGAVPYDLFMAFYNLNSERGYHKEESNTSLKN